MVSIWWMRAVVPWCTKQPLAEPQLKYAPGHPLSRAFWGAYF